MTFPHLQKSAFVLWDYAAKGTTSLPLQRNMYIIAKTS